jgi:peptidoglycan LD-endopeptidase LytH
VTGFVNNAGNAASCCGADRRQITRRQLVSGIGVIAATLGTSKLGSVTAESSTFQAPAGANEPAARIGSQRSVVQPFTPPAPGEILFPLVLQGGARAYVLDNYGDTRGRSNGYFHQGIDIMAPENTPQLAVADGVLTKRYSETFYGWTLTGDDGIVYKYFHSTSDAHDWSVGDRVSLGDVIGSVGDTGTSVGNFHLHFEYRPNDKPANPYAMLQRVDGASF